MEKDNSLLIIEENDIVNQKTQEKKEEIDPATRLKLAMRNKKLKDDFLRGTSLDDEFEDEIEKSITDMEKSVGEQVSESDDSETDSEDGVNKNQLRLIESHVLKKRFYDHLLLPFHERRRLSQCKEESESDDEAGGSSTKPKIIITPTSDSEVVKEVAKQNRFIVTKTKKEDTPVTLTTTAAAETEPKPVSILKKSPSPPDQKKLLTNSPKKIRYEAGEALRNVTSEKNSNTIHFPSSTGVSQRTNVKNFFSDVLNPHLDRRYFDSSLVEIRASQQELSNSLKSLNDKHTVEISDDVWVKRPDPKKQTGAGQKVNLSSESVRGSLKSVSVSLTLWRNSAKHCKFIDKPWLN